MSPHSSLRDLERYVEGRLTEHETSIVRLHLDECEQCQLLLTNVAPSAEWKGSERRTEPRVNVSYPGRLKLLDPVTSEGPPHDVDVIEISRSGLKIRTALFLITKTLIQIRFNNQSVLGEVRYCVKQEAGYHAGIKIVKDFPGA